MKELTIEEKAKAYDKVLEWATEAHKVCDGMLKEDLEHLFPELKESEDERMIQYFKDLAPFDKADELYEKYGFSHKDAIAWLEKQGEQKPQGKSAVEAAKEEKVDNQNCIKPTDKVEPKFKVGDYIERKDGLGCHAKIIFVGGNFYGCEKLIHSEGDSPFFDLVFKNQDEFQISSDFKQKPAEWSEEDENMLENTIGLIEVLDRETKGAFITKEYIDFLKSLKERYTWRPSDNELEVLRLAAEKDGACLMGLYEQLKKLKS